MVSAVALVMDTGEETAAPVADDQPAADGSGPA
jgi:hypothetical protein